MTKPQDKTTPGGGQPDLKQLLCCELMRTKEMGNTFEVWNWEKCCNGDDDYEWVQYYAGNDKSEAFSTIEALKAKNAACVKLEWR